MSNYQLVVLTLLPKEENNLVFQLTHFSCETSDIFQSYLYYYTIIIIFFNSGLNISNVSVVKKEKNIQHLSLVIEL